ncbi:MULTISPECIES: hypothetical protein [Sorangium]|uniref:Membrane protein n=1 Tax=Sorangium cellulosum (strain So ce56) TaxID=448385 RepID=A9G3E7_SORC5|nr:hypothetical protein [Sorangium cellulosum]CAN95754.1 putative membrane protein [Sorangium cellulosum So ce56]
MTPWFRRSAQLLVALASLSLAAPAAAQDAAAAEELFNRGLADMQAGRYESGCKMLEESERLDPQPGTLFTLAMCESQWGRIATAVTQLGNYLAWVDRMTPALRARQGDRPEAAREERDRLSPRVPRLSLSLQDGAPPGTVVKRDGSTMGPAALGVALPVNPGVHLVSTQAPGGPLWEQTVAIAEGETKALTLEVKEATAPSVPAPQAPAPAQPPAAEAGSRRGAPPPHAVPDEAAAPGGRRALVYVAGGVGAAGLLAGGILGVLALDKKSVVDEHCGSRIQASDEKACDAIGNKAAQSGGTMALMSTLGFGVGLAGLGAAAVLYWTEPKPAGPATGAAPQWLRASVLQAGPTGAVLGAQGTF